MSDFLIDLLRLALGIGSGVLAIAFAITTFRLVVYGKDAYQANRRITPINPLRVWQGRLRDDVEDLDGRTSHGVAFDLKTKQLQEQRRLSTEAIDDVIGRPAT